MPEKTEDQEQTRANERGNQILEETGGGRETLSGRLVKREKNTSSTSEERRQEERETETLEEVSGGVGGEGNKPARGQKKKKGRVKWTERRCDVQKQRENHIFQMKDRTYSVNKQSKQTETEQRQTSFIILFLAA